MRDRERIDFPNGIEEQAAWVLEIDVSINCGLPCVNVKTA
jgi:hypothetical protein